MEPKENSRNEKEENSVENEVKNMNLNYKGKLPEGITEKSKKEMEKTKKELDDLKKKIIKKYSFTLAIGILPPQASGKIEEEENIPEDARKEKPMHLLVLIPEEKFKNIAKIKQELVEQVKHMKPKVWVHVKTPVDVWNYGLDGKYDLLSATSMAFPLYDKGFLGSLRVAEIHKSLVLRKFERYVQSYVIAGSLTRGQATKTSDVDVYVVIDDTDVKRMPRLELKEKLRSIIYSYVVEAGELAGVRNKLSPQIYLLTDFWESVKDAHPVIFTFIRDGIPFYDRGTFMPWKLLLKMGKLKPSPEAIDMFMSMGDKTKETVERRLLDIVIGDIYWGIITPSQALLMLYGLAPPTPKETVAEFKKVFLEKEKMLEKRYIDILEKIVSLYKEYEHEKLKSISGKEIDELMKNAEEFTKRLKELRVQIEKRANEKTIAQFHEDVFKLLKGAFGNKPEGKLIQDFETEFIKKGKLPQAFLKVLKEIDKVKHEFKNRKISRNEVEDARKNASLLINHLIEYNQRCELVNMQKGRLKLKSSKKIYELIILSNSVFLINSGKIMKLENEKLKDSTIEELNNAIANKKNDEIKLDKKTLKDLNKNIGEFEIIL